jgi:hypothetical protein
MSRSMFRSLVLVVVLGNYGISVFAQTTQQWIMWGDASMARGEFYGASRFYAGAMELEPGRMSLQWKQAEACRLSNQYDKAVDLYEVVYHKDAGRTYPEALRWLGEMQLCDGRYEDAERTWNKVLQKEQDKGSVVSQRAMNALKGCAMAAEPDTANTTLTLAHLPQPINTYDSEFGARIGPDSALYFTSLRGELNTDEEVQDTLTYHARIYRSPSSKEPWIPAVPMEDDRYMTNTANATWTPNGHWILYTQCDSANDCRIFFSPFNSTDLLGTPMAGLGEELSTQPMVVRYGGKDWLYFVSDRAGGLGGTDIWRAEIIEAQAIDPVPLPPPVNSPGNESGPWFDTSNGTLWFASDHLPGFGGFDIFRSTLTGTNFVEPVNAGRPINSPANDLYPVFTAANGDGWLTSNRKGSFAAKGETCCNDLYRSQLPRSLTPEEPSLSTVDSASASTGINASVLRLRSERPLLLYFHNDEPEPRSRAIRTDQTYARTFSDYRDLFPKYVSENADPSDVQAFFRDDVEGGRARLDTMVSDLIIALQAGMCITLDVRGHASPLAQNEYNINLSRRRIASLRNHLARTMNGALGVYLDSTASNGAILRLRELPFGEDRAAKGVSDELTDLKLSVYSVEAARERRIEVERIHLEESTTSVEDCPQKFSIGTVNRDVPQHFEVPFRNTGTTPLLLVKGNAGCECILVDHLPPVIPAGGTGVVKISYSGRSRPGPLQRTITFTTNGTPSQLELQIEGTVLP